MFPNSQDVSGAADMNGLCMLLYTVIICSYKKVHSFKILLCGSYDKNVFLLSTMAWQDCETCYFANKATLVKLSQNDYPPSPGTGNLNCY